ncbi:MAG TPA: PKD domain-containing protein [Balneolales bacterium]|nr:PKD domain-containing protein [Balneolales bacterium]
MKKLSLRSGSFILAMIGILSVSTFFACQSNSGNLTLGPKPKASFTVTPIANKTNTYLLKSTTDGAFTWQWDTGEGLGWVKGSATDTAYYAQKGTYTVKLMAFSDGGYDTTKQSINVAKDDPNGCFGYKATLTGCSSKTWVLMPDAGALWIGAPDFSATWWSSTTADVTTRDCQFNDEWTFNKDGSFDYNNNGDIWVDNDSGIDPYPIDIIKNNANDSKKTGCYAWSDINTKYAAWGSGSHDFSIVGNTITVKGDGAFLGLYKAGDTNTTSTPEKQITYKIISMTSNKMVVAKIYDWGAWQFTFVPKP